jgi:hypothetical protein
MTRSNIFSSPPTGCDASKADLKVGVAFFNCAFPSSSATGCEVPSGADLVVEMKKLPVLEPVSPIVSAAAAHSCATAAVQQLSNSCSPSNFPPSWNSHSVSPKTHPFQLFDHNHITKPCCPCSPANLRFCKSRRCPCHSSERACTNCAHKGTCLNPLNANAQQTTALLTTCPHSSSCEFSVVFSRRL